jgi:hypothetical protein
MPIINGRYYMNPQVGRHVEDDGKTSFAKELHNTRSQIKKIWADASDGSLLSMIPEKRLED